MPQGTDGGMTDPMYSTDKTATEREMPEAGDIRHDQTPEHRVPRPGNAPAPGQRPSESGSTPSDIETDGAPDRAAETDDEHPLESPEAIRQPRDEGGEE
jgi:hypothetical protein